MRSSRAFRIGQWCLACILMLTVLVWNDPGTVAAHDFSGAVFTLTNGVDRNEVAAYGRSADGRLQPLGRFATGGRGTGGGLGSQNALVLSDNGRWLFAVNAGSNEVSVLAVGPSWLRLVDTIASGGERPTSLSVHGDVLYVLNTGGSGNITAFTIDRNGQLQPLAGSTRPLSGAATAPAQVEFAPDGKLLVVTERATNKIDTYTIGSNGLASGPTVQNSVGTTPFGFAFDRRGRLVVSEAFGGAVNKSALSSYRVAESGALSVVSPSVGTQQTAACWVVITGNGRYAYTTNTGSGSITGYRIGTDGRLTLLDADSQTAVTGAGSAPTDAALSRNSRYLYVLNSGAQTIGILRVGAQGGLTSLGSIGGLPTGVVGLAAR